MAIIERLTALEILDSRGRPTIQVTCQLASGVTTSAQVPSGASTGKSEAVELRDGDASRHAGLGCRDAARNVTCEIAKAIGCAQFDSQYALDRFLIDLDGTPNKSRLGANAILGVSLAYARAVAAEHGAPLYEHFARMLDRSPDHLPVPAINLFSGGKHAGGQVPIQDVLIVPANAATLDEGLTRACAVYRSAAEHIHEKYGMRRLVADEGGLAPPFSSARAMFDDTIAAIEGAGLRPGIDVLMAVDVASSQFFHDGHYLLKSSPITADSMIDQIDNWVSQYPIVSVEDGLAEDDWLNWPELCMRLTGRALAVGDDLLCTNPKRIRRAAEVGACNALLLKVNQIGTLTEAAEALRLARAAGWHVTISARSGETEDDWLADLAVGWGGDHIKIGSVTRSERLAKYNRLLAIAAESPLGGMGRGHESP